MDASLAELVEFVPPEIRQFVPLCLGLIALYALLKHLYEKHVSETPELHYLKTGPNCAR